MESFQLIREVSESLTADLEPNLIFRNALEHCLRFTNSEKGSIILVREDDNTLEIQYQVGLGANAENSVRLKVGEGITGRVAKTRKPILINDVSKEKDYVSVSEEIRSELVVPIVFKESLVGVVSVDSTRIDNYTKQNVDTLTIVSNLIGQALSNLSYYEEIKAKVSQDQLLLAINRELSSSLDMNETLEKVLHVLQETHYFERGAMLLFNEEVQALEMKAYFGYSQKQSEKAVYKVGEGVVGTVYLTGKPQAFKDTRQSEQFLNKSETEMSSDLPISFFCIPLISGAKAIGIMVFDREYINDKLFDQTYNLLLMLETQISKSLQIHFLARQEKIELQKENLELRNLLGEGDRFGNIIGKSEVMKNVYSQIQAVASSDSTVLITGESGTGKELVAAAIHYKSHRKDFPFIAINCAAIPENLLESELFGFKKGAFTGATQDKDGKFKLANKGTLFLDELGELPLALQSKLLRVLQESIVDPVGSEKPVKIDVRVIAATNRNLLQEIKEKNFREDLYYRLSIIPIHLPPLRDRVEDIPLLINHFIGRYKKQFKKDRLFISDEAVQELLEHPWDGNIRELSNVLERSVIFSNGSTIEKIYFDTQAQSNRQEESKEVEAEVEIVEHQHSLDDIIKKKIMEMIKSGESLTIKEVRDKVEALVIESSLRTHKGVHQQAAKLLGISRETLRKRVRELSIDIYN